MRAVSQDEWSDSESVMTLVERPTPMPTFGEVQVEVHAAGVNPVDLYTRRGLAYNRVLSLPFVNGWDVSGVVREVGYGVTRFRPGDRVFGMPWFPREAGCYAEYLTAPARHLALLPDELSFAEGAALPLAGLTAWQMLVEVARVEPGHRVLVAGAAGGVGHLAVQLAEAIGAYVIGTASAAKHEFLRTLGADETVDYTTTEVGRAVRDVDVVIQMFGGKQGLAALECLRAGGIMISGQGAWTPGMHERADELGVRATSYLVDPDGAGLDRLAELARKGLLRVHIDREFPLTQTAAAHRFVALGRTTGKVILRVRN
ncbi:MAG: NADP-dependent oxidoreductase [Pseudonocardia sp.]|nr:NADP-dependent oxidoreductase [Pseudonocardia sp.]